jgi:hypothetical protein
MSEDTPPSLSDEEARRQRQAALHALAHSQLGKPAEASAASATGTTSPSPARHTPSPVRHTPAPLRHTSDAPTPPSRRPSAWLIILSAVLVCAVIAGIVLHQWGGLPGQAARRHAGPTTVVLTPSLQGLDCIHDVAWSPDGSQVAVLGYRDLCPNDDPGTYNYQAGVLHIYAATTGKLLQTILPDAAVLALPGIPLPSSDVQPTTSVSDTTRPVIDYTHVLWSPDGKRLALTFDINRWSTLAGGPLGGAPYLAFGGLVLMNADGTGERAALWKEAHEPPFAAFYAQPALQWDTSTMSVVPLPIQPSSDYLDALPPAESYSWSAAGQLRPGASLAAATSPTAPTGNPDGGGSFSIWQTGYISYITAGPQSSSPATGGSGVYVWATDLPFTSRDGYLSWSPDGRYLIDSVSLLVIQHPTGRPNPSSAALQQLNMARAPTAPVHDQALQQVLTTFAVGQSPASQPTDYVAWSPSGRFLAAISEFGLPGSAGGAPTVPSVAIYSCATGHLLTTMAPQVNPKLSLAQLTANAYLGSTTLLRWSDDGSRILVFSSVLDTITIWGTGQLPRSS